MKVYPPLANSLLYLRSTADEYVRRHEAELLRSLKAEVCPARILIVLPPDSVAVD